MPYKLMQNYKKGGFDARYSNLDPLVLKDILQNIDLIELSKTKEITINNKHLKKHKSLHFS
jgi:hypothetical protein